MGINTTTPELRQNEPILLIFGTRDPEEIWQVIMLLSTTREKYTALTTLWNKELVHLIEIVVSQKVGGFENVVWQLEFQAGNIRRYGNQLDLCQ